MRCINYKAEVQALIIAAETISEDMNPAGQVVFLTDGLSVLQDLDIRLIPRLPCEKSNVPESPCSDAIAGYRDMRKQTSRQSYVQSKNNHTEMKTIMKSLHRPTKPTDGYQGLNRSELNKCVYSD